jgi:hypothetical protein
MSEKIKDLKQQLDNISEEVGKSILSMSAEEVDEELIALGEDPETSVNEVRDLIQSSIMQQKKNRFAKAKQQFKKKSVVIQSVISKDANLDVRNQFFAFLAQRPDIENRLTVQYRNLDELTDETISSLFDDLKALDQLNEQDDDE